MSKTIVLEPPDCSPCRAHKHTKPIRRRRKAAKVIPFRAEPTAEEREKAFQAEVKEAVARFLQRDLAQFADNIVDARVLWRKYRQLVEAPSLPENLREAYSSMHDDDPEDPNVDLGTPEPSPEQIQEAREMAIEFTLLKQKRMGAR